MTLLENCLSHFSSRIYSTEAKIPHIIGYIYCLLANLCSSFRNMYVRKANEVPHFQVFYLRVLSLTIILYMILKWQKQPLLTQSKRLNKFLIFIGLMSLIGGSCNFYGFQLLPLNEASVIYQTQPAMQGILAVLLLKEACDSIQFLSSIFCTIGVVLVVKPPFLFDGNSTTLKNEPDRLKGTISLLLSALLVGIQSITIKKTVAHVNSNLSVFYIGLIPSAIGSFLMLTQGVKEMTSEEWIMMINIIVIGFLAQVLYNRAYKFGDAGKVAVMGYSQILFGYILDIYVLETVPDFYSIIGSLFIFCCVFLRVFQTWRNAKKA